ncbi:type II toxin-antitoxin system VapC family toxin [Sphaerochaeta globosa]|uniref:Ribonuclease VapC n=1 Tax=Sphaerochaeta globosa (strain ATCC BAA-1886 / DSM 22777 / Buddy) TaxID=158189 RepID=F0RUU3_SPHGB|nr:PIN domain nuclease [Sphaerochaeta globosa]ADY12521.1 PilT protein domain protein [Sphaerochaeta globosa str. Buddy]
MMVVDTSVWIDYVNGVRTAQTDILDRELKQDRVVTGDLIIVEFLQGFRDNKQFQQARRLMDSLEYYDFIGKDMAIKAAQNFRLLRKKGVTIHKTIDVLIATFCIEHGFGLLHNDKEYEQMEKILGLRVRR